MYGIKVKLFFILLNFRKKKKKFIKRLTIIIYSFLFSIGIKFNYNNYIDITKKVLFFKYIFFFLFFFYFKYNSTLLKKKLINFYKIKTLHIPYIYNNINIILINFIKLILILKFLPPYIYKKQFIKKKNLEIKNIIKFLSFFIFYIIIIIRVFIYYYKEFKPFLKLYFNFKILNLIKIRKYLIYDIEEIIRNNLPKIYNINYYISHKFILFRNYNFKVNQFLKFIKASTKKIFEKNKKIIFIKQELIHIVVKICIIIANITFIFRDQFHSLHTFYIEHIFTYINLLLRSKKIYNIQIKNRLKIPFIIILYIFYLLFILKIIFKIFNTIIIKTKLFYSSSIQAYNLGYQNRKKYIFYKKIIIAKNIIYFGFITILYSFFKLLKYLKS